MDIIQEVFVYVALMSVITGFAVLVVVDLDRYFTKKRKVNRLNK